MSSYHLFHGGWPRPSFGRRRRGLPTGFYWGAGYGLLIACYVPQWLSILAEPEAAVQAVSPWFLIMVTAGLGCLQRAFVREGAKRAAVVGNALALANALITDAAWVWALAAS